jgi:predicted transposase/invertase (TIGR01784 family)
MVKRESNLHEPVYLNPRTDFGFKRIFGDSELLISFLNEIMPEAHIQSVEYRPTEQLGDWDTERRAVYDLLCAGQNGEYMLVEMQNVRQRFFADRALFYSSCLIRSQAPKRKVWNYELKAVYVVSILNFSLAETEEAEDAEKVAIERVSLMNERTNQPFSGKLKFVYVQLPRFTKQWKELQTGTEYWLYLLRHLENFTHRPPEVQDYIFKRLFQLALYKKLNTEEMEAYKKSILEYSDVKDAVLFAEEQAEKRGISIGEKRGISIGEKQSRIRFAVKCYGKGMSVVEIADITDLSIEEVKAIIGKLS